MLTNDSDEKVTLGKGEEIEWLDSEDTKNSSPDGELQICTPQKENNQLDVYGFYSPSNALNILWSGINNLTFLAVCSFLTLWSSAFIYLTFYYIYIPVVVHQRSINFKFDTHCSTNCPDPFSEVALSDYKTPSIFSRGQAYKFTLDLNLPESDINWSQGMFMVRLRLFNSLGEETLNAATSTILQFKSPLLRIANLLFYWPLMVTGFRTESQRLEVPLVSNYVDGVKADLGQATRAQISIEARNIQIYNAQLKIEAQLSGLRHYMVYWPLTSALLGTMSISFFLTIIIVCSFVRMLTAQHTKSS